MPPLSFSLPFALKRKNILLIRLKAKCLLLFPSKSKKENPRPFAPKMKAFVCDPGHSVKVLVVLGGAPNECAVRVVMLRALYFAGAGRERRRSFRSSGTRKLSAALRTALRCTSRGSAPLSK